MRINELAKLSGVSVRTLHHYDQIGLLRPQKEEGNNYRNYSSQDLDQLQQILLLRACGFSLKNIEELLSNPYIKQEQLFYLQRQTLLREQEKLTRMIHLLDKTEQAYKGEITMTDQQKFQGFDFSSNPYEQEARKRWGDKTVEKSQKELGTMSEGEKQSLSNELNSIFTGFAALSNTDPACNAAQRQVKKLHLYLSKFGDFYTNEVFSNLGAMYVEDERFRKNIDQFAPGTATFIHKAIQYYTSK